MFLPAARETLLGVSRWPKRLVAPPVWRKTALSSHTIASLTSPANTVHYGSLPPGGRYCLSPKTIVPNSVSSGLELAMMSPSAVTNKNREFDPEALLATVGEGRRAMLFAKRHPIFAQGGPADAIFYVQAAKVKLTVVSKTGKGATRHLER
jgi:hypothetical protein